MKNILKLFFLLFGVLSSCINENFGSNVFDGGSYRLELKGCDEFTYPESDNLYKIEKTENTILIHMIGNCAQEKHEIITNSFVDFKADTIHLNIEYKQKYLGSGLAEITECVCNNTHKFRLDNKYDINKPISIKINKKTIPTSTSFEN